jgi:hypothetical protein
MLPPRFRHGFNIRSPLPLPLKNSRSFALWIASETFPKPSSAYNGLDTHIGEEKEDHTMRGAKPQGTVGGSGGLRTGLVVSALLALVLLATACAGGSNGPGVAGGGSSSTPSASPSGDPGDAALAYSQCMREHGVSDFPDPDAAGAVNNPQLKEASDVVAEAQKACQDLSPEGGAADGGGQAKDQEVMLAYSQCMRDHGISGFPDPQPDPGGGWVIPKNGEFDPLDPAVQRADEACLQSLGADASPTEAPGD